MAKLARCAVQQLRISTPGELAITFLDPQPMRGLNRRFLRHDRATDVLCFRYDGEPVVGEILIAPWQARGYERRNDVPYAQELARYVIHGLLHWFGYDDTTPVQRRTMRGMEEQLLSSCGMLNQRGRGQETGGGRKSRAPRPVPHAPC